MSRPKKIQLSLGERLKKIKDSGLAILPDVTEVFGEDESLTERIKKMLHLLKTAPAKAIEMTFLIMYDIQDDKVRTEVAKYLKQKGCIRIQKSVFMTSAGHKIYEQIYTDLQEVQEYYENNDSVILVPFNTSDARAMKIIGKDVQVDAIVNKPNSLFF